MFGKNNLQMMAERRFDCCHELVRDANLIRERTEDILRLLERRERTGAETFVIGLQLFENIQPGTLLRLLLENFILLFAREAEFVVDLRQPFLPLFNRSTLSLCIQLFRFNIYGKFMQPRLEPGALLLELDFFSRKFFQTDNVSLLLKIE